MTRHKRKLFRWVHRGTSWWNKSRDTADHRRVIRQMPDIRLVLPTVCLYCATVLMLNDAAGLGFKLIPCLLLCAYLFTIALRSPGIFYGVLVGVLLALLQFASISVDPKGTEQSAPDGSSIRVLATVSSEPVYQQREYRFLIEPETATSAGEYLKLSKNTPVRAKADPGQLCRGNRIELVGTLASFQAKPQLTAISVVVKEGSLTCPEKDHKATIRNTLLKAYSPDQVGLLLGIAYGDDSTITRGTHEAFRVSGLLHITAVSGSNIALIFLLGYRTSYSLVRRRKISLLLAVLTSSAYVTFVGIEGSVARAYAMALIAAIVSLFGWAKAGISALCLCIVLILYIDPAHSIQLGFILSWVATLGIILLARPLTRILSIILPWYFAELASIPVSAGLFTSLVISVVSGALYPYQVLANLLAGFLIGPIMLLGLLIAPIVSITGGSPPVLSDLGVTLVTLVENIANHFYRMNGSELLIHNPLVFGISASLTLISAAAIIKLDHAISRFEP